jgi:hypothetical protein
MALIKRVTVRWSGGNIGAGFTNFYFDEAPGTAQQMADATRAFFAGAFFNPPTELPAGVTLTFPSSVDQVEPTTGILIVSEPVTQPATLVGTGSGVYAAPAGACVSWITSGVVNGHRVQGRTFLVPCSSTGLQADGTLSTVFLGQISTAAAALIAATPNFVIWHRPESLAAGGGSSHPVLAYKVSDKAAVLTSRR